MQIDWFTFVAQIINFLILIALLQRFLYKPVMAAMEEREKKIASELEEARVKKVEADQKAREMEQQLKDFESRKDEMLEEARSDVDQQRKAWMEQLRTEIENTKRQWTEGIENEREPFLIELKKETAEQIIVLIEKVLSDLSEQNLEQQTVNFFFDKLKRLDTEEQKRLQTTLQELKNKQANIITTFELTGQQKHHLTDLLREVTGFDLECEYEISEKLGFGLEVHVGGWRLGWNLDRYLEGLNQTMRRFLDTEGPVRQSEQVK